MLIGFAILLYLCIHTVKQDNKFNNGKDLWYSLMKINEISPKIIRI